MVLLTGSFAAVLTALSQILSKAHSAADFNSGAPGDLSLASVGPKTINLKLIVPDAGVGLIVRLLICLASS